MRGRKRQRRLSLTSARCSCLRRFQPTKTKVTGGSCPNMRAVYHGRLSPNATEGIEPPAEGLESSTIAMTETISWDYINPHRPQNQQESISSTRKVNSDLITNCHFTPQSHTRIAGLDSVSLISVDGSPQSQQQAFGRSPQT